MPQRPPLWQTRETKPEGVVVVEIPAVQPLRVYRLAGTQREMGRQFGELAAADGGWHAALDLYANRPTMAATMVAAGMPHRFRPIVERVADALLAPQRRRLQSIRSKQFPEYTERTRETFRAMGYDDKAIDATFVMEVLQNLIGLASRTGMFTRELEAAAIASCSSVAVWGSATVDGKLRHARNFDFPGGSIWDRAPLVVFCTPDRGQRYGYVSARGLDAPGITCFNEAGLTFTVHTRFHREVGYSGPSVIDLGHELIRTCTTLDEVAAAARRLGATSTWGLICSSAAERSAILVETTAKRVEVIESEADDDHLTCTNSYLHPAFQNGETPPGPDFRIDSLDRRCQLEAFVEKNRGAIDTESLQWLLGDYGGVDIVDLTPDVQRVDGTSVVAIDTVASIVSIPDERRIDVSVGPCPTGFGPYASVAWNWDGPVGAADDEVEIGPQRGRSHRGEPLSDSERAVSHRIAEIAHRHLEKAPPRVSLAALANLIDELPNEPSLRRIVGQLSILVGEPAAALAHLDHALTLEGTPGLREKLLLARSRAHSLLGDETAAQADRDEVLRSDPTHAPLEYAAARRESTKPPTRRALRNMAIDLLHLDAR